MLPNAIQDTIDAYLKEYERVTGQKARIWEKVRYVLSSDVNERWTDVEFTLPELVRAVENLKDRPTHKSLQNQLETSTTSK